MAIDGVKIIDSDLAHDIYNEFMDLYDSDVALDVLKKKVEEWRDNCADALEYEIFITVYAKALWEIGELTNEIITEVEEIINSENGLKFWQTESEFLNNKNINLYSQRKKILNKFLSTIKNPKTSIRKRKKYSKVKEKLFSSGDCLILREGKVIYKGIVLKIIEYRGVCDYVIMVMDSKINPDLESFIQGHFFGHKINSSLHKEGYYYGAWVIIVDHKMIIRDNINFEIIGHVNIDLEICDSGLWGGVLSKQHVINEFSREDKILKAFKKEKIPLKAVIK